LDFTRAIINAGLTGFVAGLVAADYKALTPSERKRVGHSFSLVAQTLVVIVKDWANENHIYDRFPYLFEAGSDGWGEFSQAFNEMMANEIRRNSYRMESCTLVGKECHGAQAADLLAYEYSHCMSSVIDKNATGFDRPAVRELNAKLNIRAQFHNSQTLADLLSQPTSDYRAFQPRETRNGRGVRKPAGATKRQEETT
jgi:hypothetical protein